VKDRERETEREREKVPDEREGGRIWWRRRGCRGEKLGKALNVRGRSSLLSPRMILFIYMWEC